MEEVMTPERIAAITARAEASIPPCVCEKCVDIRALLAENARLREALKGVARNGLALWVEKFEREHRATCGGDV